MRGLALLGIFVLTLILRLWGFAQGYPGFYGHVDEIGVAASIWNFFRAATLQPTEFTYPVFYSYLVTAGLWLTHAMGWGARLGTVVRVSDLRLLSPSGTCSPGRTGLECGFERIGSALDLCVGQRSIQYSGGFDCSVGS